METLELFSGTKSFSNVAKKLSHNVFTVELNQTQNPDLCKNILDVQVSDLPKKIDVLWASPPCTTFSIANTKHGYKNFMPLTSKACLGLAYVYKTIELINEIKKNNPGLIWFIENPMGYLRKFPFMNKLNRKHLWYCQYGDSRAKPTDIWTNLNEWFPKKCRNNNPDCNHQRAPRSSKNTGTQGLKNSTERSRIPENIFYEIFNIIDCKDHDLNEIIEGNAQKLLTEIII